MCFVVHRKLESFFSRILFDHIRVEKFSYLSSFLLLLLLLFFSQDKSFGFLESEVNFLMQFFVDKSSIIRTFFLFSYSCI